MKMNTKYNDFDGDALMSLIDALPDGSQKCSALSDAIRQADAANDPYWRLVFRVDCVCQFLFHEDGPKAIPIAAEFNAILEQYPNALPEDILAFSHLLIMQMAIEPMIDLPQIPRSEWKELLDQFYTLSERYQLGKRTYWTQMAKFWQYVDKEKAFSCLKKAWQTPRDEMSDCEACEHSYAVFLCLIFEDLEAADQYARPIQEHTIEYCEETPQLIWMAYLEDALLHRELDKADSFATKLYGKISPMIEKSDLSYLAAVMHCWAYTNLTKALEQIPLYVDWALSMWDQTTKYDFCKACWACFHELSKKQDTISLSFSTQFPLYQENSLYHADTLAQWFHTQAEDIAQRFDARNGTDYFKNNLAQTKSLSDKMSPLC